MSEESMCVCVCTCTLALILMTQYLSDVDLGLCLLLILCVEYLNVHALKHLATPDTTQHMCLLYTLNQHTCGTHTHYGEKERERGISIS